MVKQTTITEALAELKVIDKRIAKKREFVGQYAMRPEQLKDPLEKQGGSVTAIQQELQAIRDLEEEKVRIRRAIQAANEATTITIGQQGRSIADWLIWRRDVAPNQQAFLRQLASGIDRHRQDAMKKGGQVTSPDAAKPGDLVVNLDEAQLSREIEDLEVVLGTLDGQLSLKNATVTITY